MHAATIVQLPDAAPGGHRVDVLADRVVVRDLALEDVGLAAFVRSRPASERTALVSRALRIGLVALQDAGASLDVDAVRREFESLLHQAEGLNDRLATRVDEILRLNFGDDDGRLPRTLEGFLGDRGQLARLTRELFDEERRDSAIGRMRTLLGSFLDGDGSRLAQLLDPTRLGSPLYQFRTEMSRGFSELHERLTAIEAAAAARASERARSAAKGADFEDLVQELLAGCLRGTDHVLDRTAAESGDVLGSRKGDFVVTFDPDSVAGACLRLVVECKDRAISGRAIRDELRDARRNRDAAVGLVVFSAAHAPAGIAPFDVRMGDVYCVIDPEVLDPATLEAALRLARLLAVCSIRDVGLALDVTALGAALVRIRAELDAVRALKMRLATIGTAAHAVGAGLDQLREDIMARLAEAEAELRPGAHTG